MTSRVAALGVAVAALAAPASAAGGGFATVGLDPMPDGVAAGEPWRVELTVLSHGVTPLEGVRPRVVVSRGEARRSYAARSTARPGIYRASVVFPAPGTWRYAVEDGIGGRHTFRPVRVGGERAAPAALPAGEAQGGGGPDFPLAIAAAALAGVAAAVVSAVLMRRPRPPAPEGG